MDIREHVAFKFWKNKAGDEKHNIHCGAVIEACLGMINNTNLNKEIFIIAGWLHDLGKIIDKPNHHIESLKFLNEFLELHDKYKKWNIELKDCILNHRTEMEPKTLYGKIFQIADKVALLDKDWIDYKHENQL